MGHVDLQTHFLLNDLGDKAYLFWGNDKDGRCRKINELNLAQLGVEITHASDLHQGSGVIEFRGRIKENRYPKD